MSAQDDELAFVDSNILLYAYDRAAGTRHQRAAQLVGDLGAGRPAADDSGAAFPPLSAEQTVTLKRRDVNGYLWHALANSALGAARREAISLVNAGGG